MAKKVVSHHRELVNSVPLKQCRTGTNTSHARWCKACSQHITGYQSRFNLEAKRTWIRVHFDAKLNHHLNNLHCVFPKGTRPRCCFCSSVLSSVSDLIFIFIPCCIRKPAKMAVGYHPASLENSSIRQASCPRFILRLELTRRIS